MLQLQHADVPVRAYCTTKWPLTWHVRYICKIVAY